MKKSLRSAVKEANSLEDVYKHVVSVICKTKNKSNSPRVGFVSGIVTSDGLEFVFSNLKRLGKFTRAVSKHHKIPAFSADCVFGRKLFHKIDKNGARNEDYLNFWKRILASGHITDIFMTPRWEKSKGATDEHHVAKESGISIFYLEESLIR